MSADCSLGTNCPNGCLISVIDYTALHAHIQEDGTNCTSLANQIAVQWRQHQVAKSEEKPAVSAQGEVWFTLPETELAALLPAVLLTFLHSFAGG